MEPIDGADSLPAFHGGSSCLPRRDPRDITDRLGRRTKKKSRRARTSSSS
jgi:hypothetical protein